ncbi:MAG: hypothetical protein ACKPKO_60045, partial [Candidatus Fonsibacter sp.]
KANQSTTYTKTEVDTELAKKANTTDMNVALALKSDKTYVENQLALKANQSTTYTKREVDTELAKQVNQTDWEASYYTKSQSDTKLDTKEKPDNHFIHSNIIDYSSTNQCEYAYNKNYKYIILRCV